MLLQIAKSSLPRHGKPPSKSLNGTRQKWNFVLTHNKSLQLSAAKVLRGHYFRTCTKTSFSSKYSNVRRSPHWMHSVSVHRGPLCVILATKLLKIIDIRKFLRVYLRILCILRQLSTNWKDL